MATVSLLISLAPLLSVTVTWLTLLRRGTLLDLSNAM